jgi:peptide/nickel transport system permease protein
LARYILRRVLMMIPVILGVTIFIFLILHFAPGDPAQQILGETATVEQIETLRTELGLNEPMLTQFWRYITGVVTGDFGTSYMTRSSVSDAILSRYPTTMLLASLSVLVMVVIGIPIGIVSATKQYSIMDRTTTFIALVGVSMPTFWIGMLLILFFSLQLGWLPPSGFTTPIHWILPAFTIGFNGAAIMTRMTRSSMLEVIRSDYIRTARAKGQSERRVVIHHALKNALIPIITVVGIQLGLQLGGAMVTESVFSIPGLGSYMLTAIKARDYPVVQGGVIFIAATFSIVNLIVDIIYAFVDPRIKAQYKSRKKKKGAMV